LKLIILNLICFNIQLVTWWRHNWTFPWTNELRRTVVDHRLRSGCHHLSETDVVLPPYSGVWY